MIRFLHGDSLWRLIKAETKNAKTIKVVIAYVSKGAALIFKPGDLLIVDASDVAIAGGQTSAKVLADLHMKSVLVYSHRGLHAKLVIADSVLFSSSANLSESSETKLLEAGIRTDSPNDL